MRVLHVVRGFSTPYGAEIFLLALLDAQVAAGLRVGVVVLDRLPANVASDLETLGVTVVQLALGTRWSSGGPELRSAWTAFAPDVVHSHLGVCDLVTASATPYSAPWVSTKYSTYLLPDKILRNLGLDPTGPETQAITARLDAWANTAATSLVCVSHDVATHYRTMGVPADQVHVVPNSSIRRARNRFPIGKRHAPEGTPVLVSAARFDAHKQLHVIVDAAKTLTERGIDFVWRIFGAGEFYASIQQAIQEAGMERRVRFMGYVPHREYLEQLTSASVFVHTGSAEGLSMVVLEALSVDVPVVVAPAEGMSELLWNSEWGALTESCTGAVFADEIEATLALGRPKIASSTFVEERYTVEGACEQLVQIYESIQWDCQ